jgi:hypothetical protein
VEARPPLDEERYKRERENILVDLLNRKRQLAFTGWFEGVRQRAQIVDRRAQLMAAAQVEEEESEAEETPSAETPSTPAEEDSSQ